MKLLKHHPVVSYFLLTIAISWGGILAIVLPTTFPAPAEDAERLFVPVYLAMLAGPVIAGLTITALLGGWNGLREYGTRLVAWRAELQWYAIAIFTAPIAIALTLFTLSFISTDFIPVILSGDTASPGMLLQTGSTTAFVLTCLAIGIGAGFFEELGWTGVAVPRLLKSHSLLKTGVTVGLVWSVWHFLAIHWGSAGAVGSVPTIVYLAVALFSFLIPYRVLMTWVYQHTNSTLIGALMHASLTTSMLVMGAPVSGPTLIAYDITLAAVFWIGAAIVLAKSRGERRAGLGVPLHSGAVGSLMNR